MTSSVLHLPVRGRAAGLALLLVAAGCGGGGGGNSDVALSGRLTIPSFASASAGSGRSSGYDDDGAHAAAIRPLAGAERASGLADADVVGPLDRDPLDVRRLDLPAGRFRLRLDGDPGVFGWVIDPRSGAGQARIAVGSGVTLALPTAATVDVAIAPLAGAARWQLRCEPLGDGPAPAAVNGAELQFGSADLPADDALARYLGADFAMRDGEVVVLFASAPAERGDAAPAAELGGLAFASGSAASPVAVYALPAQATAAVTADLTVASARAVATARAARGLASQPGVRSASPNYLRHAFVAAPPRTPNDRFWELQWHFRTIGMEPAWDATTGSANVVVGVIDSGIVSAHPDFAGRLTSGFDFISDPGIALDGDGIDANPEDPGDLSQPPAGSSWHGTHVAGTIGANGNDGFGVAGMDWSCRIVPIRALGRGGSGSLGDILQAVLYAGGFANASGSGGPAVPRGRVDVLNMSLGGGGFSQPEQDIYTQVRNAGVLVVAAAGNDGTNRRNYPASYAGVLSVGATRFDDARTGYSNFADTVDVYAPGGDLGVDQNGDQRPDGVVSPVGPAGAQWTWSFLQGTSMACPHVAGLAALLLAVQPTATPAQLEDWIIRTCVDLGAPGVDPEFANGRIDAPAALALAATGGGGGGGGPTGPILVATPNVVDLGTTANAAVVNLSNAGTGRAELDLQAAGFAFPPGAPTNWIDGDAVADPSSAQRSHSAVTITVDRSVLSPGRYAATLVLPLTSGRGTEVGISLEIPDQSAAETIFVLLLDGETFDTVAQAETDESAGLRWSLLLPAAERPPAGSYWVCAGTDRDNDDFVGDEGELFGIWPFSDDTRPIDIADGGVRIENLNFALSPVDVVGNAAGRGLTFRRLR